MDSVKPKEEIPPAILAWALSMRKVFGQVSLRKGQRWPGGSNVRGSRK